MRATIPNRTWQPFAGQPAPEHFTIAVQTDRLGLYVLLAPAETAGSRVYLPVLLR